MNSVFCRFRSAIGRRHVLRRAQRCGYVRRTFELASASVTVVGPFARPFHIAVAADGTVYVTEFAGHRVVRLSADFGFEGWIGGGRPGWHRNRHGANPGAGDHAFRRPHALEIAPDGRLVVTDLDNRRIQVWSAGGEMRESFGEGDLAGPAGTLTTSGGDTIVCDAVGDALVFFDAARRCVRRIGRFNRPHSLVQVGADELVVADTWNHRLVCISGTGAVRGMFGANGPYGTTGAVAAPVTVAADGEGGIVVAEFGNHRIQRYDAEGRLRGWIGAAPGAGDACLWREGGIPAAGSGPTEFRHPYGVAVHDGALYIADTENNRIQVIRPRP